MKVAINGIFLLCLFVVTQTLAVSGNNQFCDDTKLLVSNFITSEKEKDWNTILISVEKLKKCQCDIAPVIYYVHRMRSLLPNSQALKSISPDEFIRKQKKLMRDQITILANCNKKNYFPLINSMIKQNFDPEIHDAAIVLKSELSQN